jgi:beta-phosphoglucomutase-like phosphatase (HAD superfamily)
MNIGNYKINGISFEEANGGVICTINQCGISAAYKLERGTFKPEAEYVLMDLDGTTVKSEEFWIYLIEKVVKKLLGKPDFSFETEDIPYVSGFSTVEHLSYCIKKYRINATPIEANGVYHRMAHYELDEIREGRGNGQAFRPREGLKAFLTEIKKQGKRVGLVTSGPDYKAVPEIVSVFRLLRMGDPLDYFDAVITGGKRKNKGEYGTIGEIAAKPHPWVYAEIALGLEIEDKTKAIVIEDSSSGLISARLAGFDVIGFKDGNLIQSGLSEQCYAMADTFEEILKII